MEVLAMAQLHRKFTDSQVKEMFRLLAVNQATPADTLNVRFYPLANGLTELRFWRDDQLPMTVQS
jgi:hypothetical protein